MNTFVNHTIEPTYKPVVECEDDYMCIELSSGIRLNGSPEVLLAYVQELATAVALKVDGGM